MKQMFLFLTIFVFVCLNVFAQDADLYRRTTFENFLKDTIPAQFYNFFSSQDKLKDVALLRSFRQEKKSLEDYLQNYVGVHPEVTDTNVNELLTKQISNLEKKKAKNKDQITVEGEIYYSPNDIEYEDSVIMNVDEIDRLIDKKQKEKIALRAEFKEYLFTKINLSRVRKDIADCENQIDELLGQIYQKQDFKSTISISFSALIGLLLLIYFFVLYNKRQRVLEDGTFPAGFTPLSKELLSGNGLQFITLFVLIIAVILFGILNILKGGELAAILSGISGYILGKGTANELESIIKSNA